MCKGGSPHISVGSADLTSITLGIKTHSFSLISLGGKCILLSAAKAIHTVPIIVLPGTHYCWAGQICGIKACPRLLYMISFAGIEPLTLSLTMQWPKTCAEISSITTFYEMTERVTI